MASPARLIETVSRATGVPHRTILDIDRRLVTGKLRPKGGRGLNVVQVTALDAARLITAILASAQANASAEAVHRYTDTQADETRSSRGFYAPTQIADLTTLAGQHGFVDALAALIASAIRGDLARLIENSADRSPPHLEIFAFTRATRGRIRLSGLPNGMTASVEYVRSSEARRPRQRTKASPIMNPLAADEEAGDLEQSRRVTGATIFAVAELLAEGGDG